MTRQSRSMSGKSQSSQPNIAEFYKQIIEASPSGMILVDAQADDMPIVYANAAFQRLTGYSLDEVIGRNCRFLQGNDRDQPDLDMLRDAIKNRESCAVTLRNYRKDGTLFWNELHISPISSVDGQVTHFVGIQNDVTRREDALDQLRTTSANLRAMLDSAGQSFTLIDRHARVVDFDSQGARVATDIFGKPLRKGENIYDYVLDRDLESFTANFNRALTGETITVEKTFDGQDRTYYFDVTYSPIIDTQGDIPGVCMSTENITRRRLAEIALQERETLYRLLTEHSHDMIALHEPDGTLIYASPSFERQSGFTTEELFNITPGDMIHPDDIAHTTLAHQRVMEEKVTVELDYRLQKKDGDYIHVSSFSKPILDEHGDVKQLLAVSRDITGRKQMEDALHKSEGQFRALVENSPDLIARLLRDSTHVYANPALLDVVDMTLDEIIGKTNDDLHMPPEIQARYDDIREQIYETGQEQELEVTYPGVQASRTYHLRLIPEFDEQGQVSSILSVARDITGRKQMEEALQQQHDELERFFSVALDLLCIADTDGNFIKLNKAWETTLGYPLEVLEGRRFLDFVHPDDLQPTLDAMAQLEHQEQILSFVNRYRTRSGDYRYLEWLSHPHGKFIYAAARDITGRKQMEDALARNMIDLELAQRIASVGNWTYDPEVGVPVWSNEVYHIYERDPQSGPPSLEDYRQIYNGQDFDRFWTAIQAAISEGKPYNIKLHLNLPGGKQKWIHAICEPEPEKGPAGHPLRGTIQDISEIYQAQEALRESEERYRLLANNVTDMISTHDLDGVYTFVSPSCESLLGYEPEELIGRSAYAFIYPDDLEAVQASHQTIQRQASHYTANYRIRRKAGGYIWFETISRIVTDETIGEAQMIIAVSRDITERKQMEEALRQSEQEFRTLAENSPDSIQRLDRDGKHLYVNNIAAYAETLSLPVDQIIGKTNEELGMPPESIAFFAEMRERVYISRQPVEFDFAYPVNGEMRYFNTHMIPEFDPEGNVVSLLSVSRDITGRKRMQEHEFELSLERERRKLLTSFIQDAAHEFRTPLSMINSSAYLMSRSEDAVRRIQKARQIERYIHHIAKLLDMLLMMAKLEGSYSLSSVPVDMAAVIQQAWQEMTEKYGSIHDLRPELPAQLPVVPGNADYLIEALKQVIENACRFTLAGGIITLSAQTQDEQVRIAVRDTGPGIPPDDLPRIFETFWRHDKVHNTPGFGLGLPIAQKIIEQHGGAIRVESIAGKGSTFIIELPIA